MQNFASWRNYLHKYFSLIFILIGATGILQTDHYSNNCFKFGVFLSLVGVFIGYIFINVYFYIERKWFYSHHLVSLDGAYKIFEHPKSKTDDIHEAMILHCEDTIRKLEKELKQTK